MNSFYESAINTSVKRKALIEFAFHVYGNSSTKNVFRLFREDDEFDDQDDEKKNGFIDKLTMMDSSAFQGNFFTRLGFAAAAVTALVKIGKVGDFALGAYKYNKNLLNYFKNGWSKSFGSDPKKKLMFLEKLIKEGDNFLSKKIKVANPHITMKWIHVGVFLALFLTIISKVGFRKVVTAFWKAIRSGVKALIAFFKWFFNWVKDTILGLTNIKKQFGEE